MTEKEAYAASEKLITQLGISPKVNVIGRGIDVYWSFTEDTITVFGYTDGFEIHMKIVNSFIEGVGSDFLEAVRSLRDRIYEEQDILKAADAQLRGMLGKVSTTLVNPGRRGSQ